jgi:hypothetical protein
MLLDMKATRCFSSLISVSRREPSADDDAAATSRGSADEGRIEGAGATALAPPPAAGIDGGAADEEGEEEDDEDEDDADGILLISVRRSSLPLRKESWRNLQNLEVSASRALSMRREFENLTLRKP